MDNTCQGSIDGEGVFTIGILVDRRQKALKREDRSLFPSTRAAGRAMDSKEATHGLQLLVKHLKLPYRVSSHSARKGAATEAVLAGLPLVAIQAYGLWKEAGSLQKYVGEALRQRFPFLDALWGLRGTQLGRS